MAFDQELEDKEIAFLKEQLNLRGFIKASENDTRDIRKFIYNSLFDYDRARKVYFTSDFIERLYLPRITRTIQKHLVKVHKKYGLRYVLIALFSKRQDDVVYRVYVDDYDNVTTRFLEHETRAVDVVCNLFREDLYEIRQEARIYYRKLWKKARKDLEKDGDVVDD